MRVSISKIGFVVFLFFVTQKGFSQKTSLSKTASISVLSCDAGNELYSIFGHSAIRVQEPGVFDIVFNYGYFDFRTPDFYRKFVQGDLDYFVAVDQYQDFYNQYVYEQRGVFEQKLQLSGTQKQAIFDELSLAVSSDKRFYHYKFIDQNCTTMLVDVLNHHLDHKISTQIADASKTNRTILDEYSKNLFYENMGINMLFGAKTDQSFDHIFLPMQMLEGLKVSSNNNKQLAENVNIINKNSLQKNTFSIWNNPYSFVSILLLVLFLDKRWVQIGYFSCIGLVGFLLGFVGAISNHNELMLNYNLLLFNPIMFITAVFLMFKSQKTVRFLAFFCFVLLIGYAVLIADKVHLRIFWPMILVHFILYFRLFRFSFKGFIK